jgi:hypothetical protein
MPDLSVVPGSVALVSAGSAPTVTARGLAGAVISPGQVVYADPSAANVIKPARANEQLQAANVVGIAMGSASPNQPITYAVSGDVTLPTTGGAGTALMSGSVYVLSAGTAGNLISTADTMAAGNYVSVLGVGNGTATNTVTSTFRLNVIAAAAPK